MRKEFLSVIFALGVVIGTAGSAMGENRLVPAMGVTEGAGDGRWVNETGDDMTGALTIDLSGLPLYLTNSTDNASNEVLRLYSDRATPAVGDEAFMNFNFNNETPAEITHGRIGFKVVKLSAVDGESDFFIQLLDGSALFDAFTMSIDTGFATFKDLSLDLDGGGVRVGSGRNYGFFANNTAKMSIASDGGTGTLQLSNMASATSRIRLTSATATVNADACRMENFNTIYLEAVAGVQVPGVGGVDYLPGSDTNTDLITVGVTAAPRLWWNESADRFEVTKGLTVPDATAATDAMNQQASDARYLGVGSSKAGTVAGSSFAGNPKIFTVTFNTAFPDANYAITITAEDNRTFTFQTKQAASFVMNSNANLALVGDVDWTAKAHNDP